MGWSVVYAKSAYTSLISIPERARISIVTDFSVLAADPFARSVDIKKLQPKSAGQYRLRVGRWRAIFELDKNRKLILVLRVDDRRDAY